MTKHMRQSQYKKVESTLRNSQRMRFMKQSAKTKCMMSFINEEFSTEDNLNEEEKKGANNELVMIAAVEDNDLF